MIDIYKEFGVDVLRDSENAGPTAAEMKMAREIGRLRAEVEEQARLLGMGSEREAKLLAEIERLRARVDALREPLAVYVHAHETGNSVPPHIEAAARAALEAKP